MLALLIYGLQLCARVLPALSIILPDENLI